MIDEVGDEALLRRFLDVRRTGSVHVSEDLLQETLIRVYRKGRSFRGEGSLRSWIYSVALNLARSRGRSAGRRPAHQSSVDATAAPAEEIANGRPDPAERASRAELGEAIRKAVHALPDMQQEVFILRHYQDLPFPEIAKALDVSPVTCRTHMHRALASLREKLGFLQL
ncbi:MAG: RNA polymerase sigma factor [Planctomycetota bacterium]|jgi:RNA polymerase sigma-70 factor (ECF subfamily)